MIYRERDYKEVTITMGKDRFDLIDISDAEKEQITKRRVISSEQGSRLENCPTASLNVRRYFYNCKACISHKGFDGTYVCCAITE